jgi:hypothetical protein
MRIEINRIAHDAFVQLDTVTYSNDANNADPGPEEKESAFAGSHSWSQLKQETNCSYAVALCIPIAHDTRYFMYVGQQL